MSHFFRHSFVILSLYLSAYATNAETYHETVLRDAPALYYRFETVNHGVIPDLSGYGRDGVLTGRASLAESSAADELGKCLQLRGGTDGVSVKCAGDRKIAFPGRQITVELWLMNTGRGWNTLLNADGFSNGEIHYQFHDNGTLQFCVAGRSPGETFFDFLSVPGLKKTQWNHLVVTYNATIRRNNLQIYVNGKRMHTATIGVPNTAEETAFTLGESFTVGNWRNERGFRGLIDELAVYDQILTPEQIESHYLAAGEIRKPEPDAAEQVRMTEGTRNRLLAHGVEKIAFIKRYTYTSNHYYTEYINAAWLPGGNLCVLDVKTGEVRDLCPELTGGVFERMDVNFDGTKIVFAWKKSNDEGYRIYEANLTDGSVRQVVPTPTNEAALVARYRNEYHHGTDDMSPCYLPDGGICFISTRCQYGILCDGPDIFTTTVLYRCDADGKNIHRMTNSSVSEAAPVCLSDGRILYTRWEYVDKGAVSVKCLWTIRPDGTGSAELYGNDVSLPPTFIYGREIPDAPGHFVFTGTPHCPQSAMGTIIRLDMSKDIRTRAPMTYMTPYVDVQEEPGWHFLDEYDKWQRDGAGYGPLFKEAFPLSMSEFIVSHKPDGEPFTAPAGYGLYLLDENGKTELIYRDPEISCWNPVVLQERPQPPVLHGTIDETLAAQNLAHCLVMDVYHGMDKIPRGSVKYLRVLEQIPRPWGARRPNFDDEYDQQHAVVSKDAALGLKVQHGVVPVAEDGSASFLVPAEANIYFQALDENFMALQTERTYVNYMPGEIRSCIGCHETPHSVQAEQRGYVNAFGGVPEALWKIPQLPVAQRGEATAQRVLDYAQDVQPVWDRHCLECHSSATAEHPDRKVEGNLNLSGEMTRMFNVSYESLVPERRQRVEIPDRGLLGQVIGENHPKTGNVHYLPAKSLGSHTSVLAALLANRKITLADPAAQVRVEKLRESHRDVHLTDAELLKVTNWIDTNCQYYGSYHGWRNLKYREDPDFRPVQTFEAALDKKEIPLETE